MSDYVRYLAWLSTATAGVPDSLLRKTLDRIQLTIPVLMRLCVCICVSWRWLKVDGWATFWNITFRANALSRPHQPNHVFAHPELGYLLVLPFIRVLVSSLEFISGGDLFWCQVSQAFRMLKVTDSDGTCEALIPDELISKVEIFQDMVEVVNDPGCDDPVRYLPPELMKGCPQCRTSSVGCIYWMASRPR